MIKILRIAMIGLGLLLVAGILVFAGAWIGVRRTSLLGWMYPVYGMIGNAGQHVRPGGYGMMGNRQGMTLPPALRFGASTDAARCSQRQKIWEKNNETLCSLSLCFGDGYLVFFFDKLKYSFLFVPRNEYCPRLSISPLLPALPAPVPQVQVCRR